MHLISAQGRSTVKNKKKRVVSSLNPCTGLNAMYTLAILHFILTLIVTVCAQYKFSMLGNVK